MTKELGFYKDQTEYYKRSIEDLLHHYTDSCSICTVNLDCSECVVDNFINQLRNILYSSSEYKGENICSGFYSLMEDLLDPVVDLF